MRDVYWRVIFLFAGSLLVGLAARAIWDAHADPLVPVTIYEIKTR